MSRQPGLYLCPDVSHGDPLLLRDSGVAGPKGFSPTALIFRSNWPAEERHTANKVKVRKTVQLAHCSESKTKTLKNHTLFQTERSILSKSDISKWQKNRKCKQDEKRQAQTNWSQTWHQLLVFILYNKPLGISEKSEIWSSIKINLHLTKKKCWGKL